MSYLSYLSPVAHEISSRRRQICRRVLHGYFHPICRRIASECMMVISSGQCVSVCCVAVSLLWLPLSYLPIEWSTLATDPNTRRVETTTSSSSLLLMLLAETIISRIRWKWSCNGRGEHYGDWCQVWQVLRCTLDILQWPWPRLQCMWDLVQCTWLWVRCAWIQLQCPGIFLQSERIIQRVGL